MGRECVRCVVTLALKEVHWEEPPGAPLHLEGPPVFLRACVLGQLQHSPIVQPTFPLRLHGNNLVFDRVFTNCTDPHLLREIVTGEHVYIEMIQVTDDYEGGRILARYEAPSDEFLFSEDPLKPGRLRTLALSESRKYHHCPQLTLCTSTSVTKVTIHTPTFHTPPPSQKPPSPHTKGGGCGEKDFKPTTKSSSQKVGVTTQDKLRLLLDSYTEPHPQRDQKREDGRDQKQPTRKTKIKPPLPKFTSREKNGVSGGQNFKAQRPLTSTDLHQCCTAFFGPHNWTTCPRRSFRKYRVAPGEQKSRRSHSNSAPSHRQTRGLRKSRGPLTFKQDCVPQPQTRVEKLRPFVAGGVDPKLLAKREFCGQSSPVGGRVEKHIEGTNEGKIRGGFLGGRAHDGKREGHDENPIRLTEEVSDMVTSIRRERGARFEGDACPKVTPTIPQQYQQYPTAPSDSAVNTMPDGTPVNEDTHTSETAISTDSEQGSVLSPSSVVSSDVTAGDSVSPLVPSPVNSRRQRHNLLSKYLQDCEHGNGRTGTGTSSPARLIDNKLNALIQECCECRHSVETLGQDDITEDNERLRASLLEEREEHLNRSAARLLPSEKSIIIGLGGEGAEDYWSQRLAQFQGKHHRQVFHETMEKIYSRLYQNSISMN